MKRCLTAVAVLALGVALSAQTKAPPKPPPLPNAEEMFESALNEAKKEQKALFLWFSAPW